MCYRGYFRENIFEKCVLCKKENNVSKHIINEYIELKKLRDKLIYQLHKLDKKIDTLEKIFLLFYAKNKINKIIHNISNLENLIIKKMNKL